ncbi:hypothetical protein niasHS_011544 [Heterodera schachtii]|uniref:Chromo domain-containing protein n=1 Tax=Heterodera schachtii TaxID=97005 RepID=A0ABD2IPR3_HETSC
MGANGERHNGDAGEGHFGMARTGKGAGHFGMGRHGGRRRALRDGTARGKAQETSEGTNHVDEVPELGPNPHGQVVEVAEDAVSAAYSSDPEFEVERICGQKRVNGHQYYLVKWVRFAKDQNDWIPVGDLSHCEEAINDYWQRYREGREYRERKKEGKNKVKKTGHRKRKVAEMVTAAGENEQKEEQQEQEKNGVEKELQQQPPVNVETETQQGKLANEKKSEALEETDGEEKTEEAKEEAMEELLSMLSKSGQIPPANAPLPLPRWK